MSESQNAWHALQEAAEGWRSEAEQQKALNAELLKELRHVTDHLQAWARDHASEETVETWAVLYCARAAITKAERPS
jgi:hypothetical protein